MPDFKLVDHSDEVKEELQEAVLKALEEIGLRVERRAKKYAPVDTGLLRSSISHKVLPHEDAVVVGAMAEYSTFVELGTRKTPAQPFLTPAVVDTVGEMKGVVKKAMKKGG